MATPNLSLVPALTTTYNVGMADTFSWVPIDGAGRPLFARATYLANASDISVSLSAGDLNVNLNDVENLVRESNTLLNALTAKNIDIDLNLSAIDVNTDEVESLIRESNTLLNNLTGVNYATTSKQDLTNTLLNNLTGVNYATTSKQDLTNTLLATITATSNRINGFVVPNYNKIKNFYYGSSTNISSVQYLLDTTVVAELSFTYVDPTSAEGARLDEVIKL